MSKRIVIIAGELSGDFHSASLIQALKKIKPDIEIAGLGGQKMRAAGANLYFDISELSIIGFTDVLKNIKKIRHVFKTVLERIDAQRPQACVLVDYPGFNLKLARELKKRAIPVIYYISPQIWAWWQARIKTIQRFVDKMIVVFQFEESLYRQRNINVSFVGHPLLDIAHPKIPYEEFLAQLGFASGKKIIGLVPGSRIMEVKRILPILLESAKIIKQRMPEAQFLILKTPELPEELFTQEMQRCKFTVRLCENNTYDFLSLCEFVLIASGTATLEAAIMQTPMVIVYKVSFLNWLIARSLIKLPFIGLVNVVAGRKIIPEFIQFQARPQLIAQATQEALANKDYLTKVKQDLQQVRKSLGRPGASRRAAQIILNHIS